MDYRNVKANRTVRAGNAGLIACFVFAIAGIGLGALSTYIPEMGSAADAARRGTFADTATVMAPGALRDQVVERVISQARPERFDVPAYFPEAANKPRIVIVLDDMGLNSALSLGAIRLPGPLTFSFLPYASSVNDLVPVAKAAGGEVMLHLPMQPVGSADPGPMALTTDMPGTEFINTLEWNLTQFEGFTGVNNHMGSKLTSDPAAMKTVLAYLHDRGLFFLDSVTTGASVVREAGAQVGVDVLSRDVFLDAQINDRDAVREQLALVEHIALETGYAVAIGHPREDTLAVLGPWLASIEARGFELITVSSLLEKPASVLVQAPELRL